MRTRHHIVANLNTSSTNVASLPGDLVLLGHITGVYPTSLSLYSNFTLSDTPRTLYATGFKMLEIKKNKMEETKKCQKCETEQEELYLKTIITFGKPRKGNFNL